MVFGKKKTYVVSLYEFEAETEGELSVSEGETLKLHSEDTEGWTLVKKKGRKGDIGYVPTAYIQTVDSNDESKSSKNKNNNENNELSDNNNSDDDNGANNTLDDSDDDDENDKDDEESRKSRRVSRFIPGLKFGKKKRKSNRKKNKNTSNNDDNDDDNDLNSSNNVISVDTNSVGSPLPASSSSSFTTHLNNEMDSSDTRSYVNNTQTDDMTANSNSNTHTHNNDDNDDDEDEDDVDSLSDVDDSESDTNSSSTHQSHQSHQSQQSSSTNQNQRRQSSKIKKLKRNNFRFRALLKRRATSTISISAPIQYDENQAPVENHAAEEQSINNDPDDANNDNESMAASQRRRGDAVEEGDDRELDAPEYNDVGSKSSTLQIGSSGALPTKVLENLPENYAPVDTGENPDLDGNDTENVEGENHDDNENLNNSISENLKSSEPKIYREPSKFSQEEAAQITTRNVRRWLLRKRFFDHFNSKEYSKMKHRNHIMREILGTEQSYIRSLEACVQAYLYPMKEQKFIDSRQITRIFSNMEQILSVNQELEKQLLASYEKWPSQSRIGHVFKAMAPFLKAYTPYVNRYNNNKDETKNPKLESWLKEQALNHPSAKGMQLSSFLIMPVQRIPRYRMLLQDLLKHTPEEHVDYQDIKEALDSIAEIAVTVNERRRETENSDNMIGLQNKLKKRYKALVQPHRKFILEGKVRITCKDLRIFAEEMKAFLLSDLILFIPRSASSSNAAFKTFFVFLAFAEMLPFNNGINISAFCGIAASGQNTALSGNFYGSGKKLLFVIQPENPQEIPSWENGIHDQSAQLSRSLEMKGIKMSRLGQMGEERIRKRIALDQKADSYAKAGEQYVHLLKKAHKLERSIRHHLEQLNKIQDAVDRDNIVLREAAEKIVHVQNTLGYNFYVDDLPSVIPHFNASIHVGPPKLPHSSKNNINNNNNNNNNRRRKALPTPPVKK